MIRILAPMGSRSFFGSERANVDLLWRMQKQGAEVHCIVRHEDWPENIRIRNALSARGLLWERAVFPEYPSSRYWRYWPKLVLQAPWRYLRLNRQVSRTIHRKAITHIHLFNPFQAASLHRVIERTNLAVVYRLGEMPVLHNAFYRQTWRWLARRTNRFVSESYHLQSALRKLDVPKDRICVIRTPPPTRLLGKKVAAPSVPRSGLGPIFAYVGQIAEFKGVEMLVDAMKIVRLEHSTAVLQLAGPIESEWAMKLVERTAHLKDTGAVVFLGAVDDIPNFLTSCDVHIAPSLKPEGYGLVAIEAKEAGLPSIVFAEGGLAELVAPSEGRALTEKTPRALADAMLDYCRNRDHIIADGIRAHASLIGRLGVHLHDDAWYQTYSESLPE